MCVCGGKKKKSCFQRDLKHGEYHMKCELQTHAGALIMQSFLDEVALSPWKLTV